MDDKLYREVSVFITFDINEEPINNFSKIFENAKDIDRLSLITVLIQRASYYYREIMYKEALAYLKKSNIIRILI
ncbi:unnamed protein product [Rotaria sp. Silwood2]|nr:unnamed protein product [Rotaria sp. Silwood2]